MSEEFVLVDGADSGDDSAELRQAVAAIDRAVAAENASRRVQSKAKAAPKAACTARGRASGPPRTVAGPLPPVESSTGRRYYLLLHCSPPVVACGYPRALEILGGTWTGRGRIPEGFGSLESAVNAAAGQGHDEVRIRL